MGLVAVRCAGPGTGRVGRAVLARVDCRVGPSLACQVSGPGGPGVPPARALAAPPLARMVWGGRPGVGGWARRAARPVGRTRARPGGWGGARGRGSLRFWRLGTRPSSASHAGVRGVGPRGPGRGVGRTAGLGRPRGPGAGLDQVWLPGPRGLGRAASALWAVWAGPSPRGRPTRLGRPPRRGCGRLRGPGVGLAGLRGGARGPRGSLPLAGLVGLVAGEWVSPGRDGPRGAGGCPTVGWAPSPWV